MKDVLFFNQPPEKWEHYLPLGNGRLGAMVKAHPCNEIIQLNEEGIWSGGPQDRTNPSAKENLEKIRELVKAGKVKDAQELAFRSLTGTSVNERVYQTAGDFHIDFYEADNYGIECGFPLQHKTPERYLETYKSTLDLSKACTTVTYEDEKGVRYERRTWISAPDDMLFMYVTASEKGKINFRGYLDRGIWCDSVYAEDDFIFLEDSHGIPFCAGAGAVAEKIACGEGNANNKKAYASGFCLCGENCNKALFFIDISAWQWKRYASSSSEYKKNIQRNTWTAECKRKLLQMREFILEKGVEVAVEELFARHLNEYKSYWNKMSLRIGSDEKNGTSALNPSSALSDLPTPELLLNASPENTELVNLYASFSRYLLISGSREPGKLPLTLQGLWNCYMDPPWGSKYTININAQMNYWPVHLAGLSECELPLFNLLERAYENGCRVAKEMYGCRGYVLHHNTDFWGDAAPQDAWLPGTYWVLGAAWLAIHIWEHYEYTLNKKFLYRYYYLIHDACLFFVDFLQPCSSLTDNGMLAPDGKPYLVLNPSLSPENSYVTKAGEAGAFTEGCEMDNMILEQLFTSCLKAKSLLQKNSKAVKGKDDDFKAFEYVLAHLKKPELNSDGSLMEWNTEVQEVEPGHRHISHLYGLFPGHTITLEKTPELAEACKKTLEKRLANGGGHTGWSQAWIINFRAQLGQGNEALSSILKLFNHSTLPNLLDNHPPFQIDGNFGTLAAIIRMLVQSEVDEKGIVRVKLLPALPEQKEWQQGSVRGVGLKGGVHIDFDWKNGKAQNIRIYNRKMKKPRNVRVVK
ncbi:MAG: glycoside hydrolase family 95 protein [Treponema sp.]|nr:glycoside hydrolase family 95 protein [Treponema sp.]